MIKFGPSGNSESFLLEKHKGTEEAAKWCFERGLDCYEYSFGRGVNMSEEKAVTIGKAFKEFGIDLSVHAPYFINYATTEEEKAENSYNYVLNSAKMMRLMQGERVIFHPAAQGKLSRQVAVEKTLDRLKVLRDKIYFLGYDDMKFCPETMGKLGQIGTIEEVVEFCKIDKCYIPTVDFGHVNAREGGSLKTASDFQSRLEYMIEHLGYDKMKNFHVHFSKIQYSVKGEIRHLTFEDEVYGPDFEPLAIALKNLKLEPVIVCESAGTQAEDARKMKDIFLSL